MAKRDPYAALRFKEFNIFLVLRFILVFGWSMQFIIIEWQVYSLTKNPLSLGIIGLMEIIPAFSMALFAGHIVDQNEKRNLLLKATKHAQRYDTHPLPTEHIAYLEEIFNQPFSDKVKQLAKDDEKKWFSNPVTSIAKNRDNTYYGLESLQQIVSLPG